MKKNISVLYGGRSGEHEVSLVSAASIVKNLDPLKYDVRLIGIDRNGVWYLQNDDELDRCRSGAASLALRAASDRRVAVIPGGGVESGLAIIAPDGLRPLRTGAVFPALHGTFGEDGTVQGLLEMASLPYVGAGVLGSAIGMDKDKAKTLWAQAGLPIVPYIPVRMTEWNERTIREALLDKAEREFGYPLFVKPSSSGSSVGAGKAADRTGLAAAIEAAFAWDDKVLIEPFLAAREVECSVTGNERPQSYTPGEIVPSHEFYDYEAKYIDPDGAALLIPARLEERELRTVREIAEKAYSIAELSGLARVDFFIRKDDGQIVLNEVNTMPGFTTISMFPKMCEASGLPYPRLLDHLIDLAIERGTRRANRDYTRRPHAAERR